MKWQVIETKKGTRCRVWEGGSGAPVVFLHSAGGLLRDNPFLDQLAQGYSVFAPEWPGYGERSEEHTSELQSLAYLVCRLRQAEHQRDWKSVV